MNILQWRKLHCVTQDQMADAIETSRPHLSKVERGATEPSPDLARRIEAFTRGEVSAASLLGLEDAKPRRRSVREDSVNYQAAESVSVDVPLSTQQRQDLIALSIDIEAVARAGAQKALAEAHSKVWAEANRDAIDAYNVWIEKHGTLAEQFGTI